MQKLYKIALQRVLTKIGADKLQNPNLSSLTALLNEKKIPLSEIDETLFHKIPREQLKNLVRNPCPISKPQQTSSDIVKNAKAVRGALSIVEKKICFRCPFVDKCDQAFVEPTADFKIQNHLENLLISMKNIADAQKNNGQIKNRSWFSGVRVCDSLNSVMDELLQGGEEFKTFKKQRNLLQEEAEEKQKSEESESKQVLKAAKKNKVPLKDIHAQIPDSKPQQNQTQKDQEETLQQVTKGPGNIFKQKKGDQFIKIAQKYLNQDQPKQSSDKKFTKMQEDIGNDNNRFQDKEFSQGKRQRRQYKQEPERTVYKGSNSNNQQWGQKKYNRRQENMEENGRGSESKWQKRQRSPYRKEQSDRDDNPQRGQGFNRQNYGKQNNWNSGYEQRKVYRGNEQGQNPKIRRFTKERPQQNQNPRRDDQREERPYRQQSGERSYRQQNGERPYRQENRERPYRQENRERPYRQQNGERSFKQQSGERSYRQQNGERPNRQQNGERPYRQENGERNNRSNNKVEKFYSEMREQKSDQQEILSQLNKRQFASKDAKLPKDAKFSNNENQNREQKPRDFSNEQMQQFEKLERVPKILKTQFASKQDLQERIQQEKQSAAEEGERKGRRVKRN